MATGTRVDGGSGMSGVIELLNLLGGQKGTTTTSSDTGALQGVLGNLQGTDYSNVLQSIFQQAGGQIPGLTAGVSNAIGARSGGNTAVATMLGKLLESTTMKATDRLAQLQQGNQQLQIQAANGIAQGNSTRTSTQGTDLSRAGKVVGGLQLGGKVLNSEMGQKAVGKGKNLFDSLFNPSEVASGFTTDALTDAGFNLSLGEASGFDAGGDFGGSSLFSDFGSSSLFGDATSGFYDAGSAATDIDYGSLFDGGGSVVGDATVNDIPWWEFADGGLVGRDGKRGEPKVGTKGPVKAGGTGGGLSKESTAQGKYAEPAPKLTFTFEPGTIPRVEKGIKEATGYADGGVVRTGGGRASSRVNYETDPVNANATLAAPTELLNEVGPGGELILPKMQLPGAQMPNFGIGGAAKDPSGSGSGWDGNPASTPLAQMLAGFVGNYMLNQVVGPVGMAALNATSGITGFKPPQGPTGAAISGLLGMLRGSSSPYNTAPAAGATGDSVNGTPTSYTTGSGTSYTGESSSGSASNSSDSGSDSSTPTGGGMANGGHVQGKGTGISDSIPAKLSKNEYVVSADVVEKMGVDFFDSLQAAFHTPAAVQRASK